MPLSKKVAKSKRKSATDALDARMRQVLGSKVRALRQANSLTQLELARMSGVSRPLISEIESGNANVTLLTGGRLAAALGTTIQNLLS